MNIALLGPPGAGKGTHARLLGARFRLSHGAPGDLLRDHVRRRTALGRIAQNYMDTGALVPDEIVDAVMAEWADALGPDDGALFDGYPRTFEQVGRFESLLRSLQRPLAGVVYLHAPDSAILERLAHRLECLACHTPYDERVNPPKTPGLCDRCGAPLSARPDDRPDLVRFRLALFHRTHLPVLQHYARIEKLALVRGDGPLDAVRAALTNAFTAIADHSMRFSSVAELTALFAGAVATSR